MSKVELTGRIKIEVEGGELELTHEEAKNLMGQLNALFNNNNSNTVWWPNTITTDPNPFTITCSDSTQDKGE